MRHRQGHVGDPGMCWRRCEYLVNRACHPTSTFAACPGTSWRGLHGHQRRQCKALVAAPTEASAKAMRMDSLHFRALLAIGNMAHASTTNRQGVLRPAFLSWTYTWYRLLTRLSGIHTLLEFFNSALETCLCSRCTGMQKSSFGTVG